jgi:hypothetical protein
MRRKLLIGGLGVLAAVLVPSGLGTGESLQALDCPGAGLDSACAAANLVVGTACYTPLPAVGTIGFVTIDVEGGAPLQCPTV